MGLGMATIHKGLLPKEIKTMHDVYGAINALTMVIYDALELGNINEKTLHELHEQYVSELKKLQIKIENALNSARYFEQEADKFDWLNTIILTQNYNALEQQRGHYNVIIRDLVKANLQDENLQTLHQKLIQIDNQTGKPLNPISEFVVLIDYANQQGIAVICDQHQQTCLRKSKVANQFMLNLLDEFREIYDANGTALFEILEAYHSENADDKTTESSNQDEKTMLNALKLIIRNNREFINSTIFSAPLPKAEMDKLIMNLSAFDQALNTDDDDAITHTAEQLQTVIQSLLASSNDDLKVILETLRVNINKYLDMIHQA